MSLHVPIEYDGSNVSNEKARIVVGEDEEWGGIGGSQTYNFLQLRSVPI
jgi:hypothetical protein